MKHIFFFLLLIWPASIFAQTLVSETEDILRGRVERIATTSEIAVAGLDIPAVTQELDVRILDGSRAGETISVFNDYLAVREGDVVYVSQNQVFDNTVRYTIIDIDRRMPLGIILAVAGLAVIGFARMVGIRSLVALGGGVTAVGALLIPLLLAGHPPLSTTILVVAPTLFVIMVITHGINRVTIAASLGTFGGLIATGLFATVAVWGIALSGFISDESVYLNIATHGALNLSGLFLAGVIIGVLGVLDDVAITQASTVRELASSNLSRREVFAAALRIGRDHVGALVNTLAFAYAGASLPLLLLFSVGEAPWGLMLSREAIAAELVRTAAGTIGIVLTAPLATVAALMFFKKEPKD